LPIFPLLFGTTLFLPCITVLVKIFSLGAQKHTK
jgi:hypothetical protein